MLVEKMQTLSNFRKNESNYLELSRLACSHLQIPASSAPVERLFSIAGKIFRPDRCQLADEPFEKFMFIRAYSGIHYVDLF